MASAIVSGRAFAAPWLPAAAVAVGFTARCGNTFGFVANLFVPVAPPPRVTSAVLVAIPLVLVAIPLAFDVLFAARCGTASAA